MTQGQKRAGGLIIFRLLSNTSETHIPPFQSYSMLYWSNAMKTTLTTMQRVMNSSVKGSNTAMAKISLILIQIFAQSQMQKMLMQLKKPLRINKSQGLLTSRRLFQNTADCPYFQATAADFVCQYLPCLILALIIFIFSSSSSSSSSSLKVSALLDGASFSVVETESTMSCKTLTS